MAETDGRLFEAARIFTGERIEHIRPLRGGHINQSFLVTGGERYVLQCLNRELYANDLEVIGANYIQYRNACEISCDITSSDGTVWICPEWMRDAEGDLFSRDANGDIWRMYRYIRSDAGADGQDGIDVYEAGAGLGKIHRILSGCKGIGNTENNSRLYDLTYHFGRYSSITCPRQERSEELDRLIEEDIDRMLDIKLPAGKVIHGDAKPGNMIIRSGKVTGFIDLDTIMTGSVFNDLADLVRSFCMGADGRIDRQKLERLLRGYGDASGSDFEADDELLLMDTIRRNRFMLGIRYYTDYLTDEGYFADMDPQQKLGRARTLLATVSQRRYSKWAGATI